MKSYLWHNFKITTLLRANYGFPHHPVINLYFILHLLGDSPSPGTVGQSTEKIMSAEPRKRWTSAGQSVAVGAKKIWPKALSLNIYCIDDRRQEEGLNNTFSILNIILSSIKIF